MIKVLITDATYKHTLGAIRSLGERGIYVIAGASSKYAQSFYSRYCSEELIYPDPRNEDEFAGFLLKYVKDNKIDVLLPVGYLATIALSKHKDDFCKYTKLPIANRDSMEIASDKDKTLEFAKNLGIAIPKTYNTIEEIVNFPIVVKGIKECGRIRYVNSQEELSKITIANSVLQEYIPGEGYGFLALFNNGEARAIFMHKRIRQYPVTGGPSTAAESIYDPKLRELGTRLLKALNWHGVAMVEFKKDLRDGEFKLMEINPKFWGSLDLSIASGVDFPYLIIKMAIDGDIEPVLNYKVGIKFRWLFPDDILHLLANPGSIGAFVSDFFDKNTKSNIRLNDIKPNLFQILMTIDKIKAYIRNSRSMTYPHGRPKAV